MGGRMSIKCRESFKIDKTHVMYSIYNKGKGYFACISVNPQKKTDDYTFYGLSKDGIEKFKVEVKEIKSVEELRNKYFKK
jgi:hypothetical protein